MYVRGNVLFFFLHNVVKDDQSTNKLPRMFFLHKTNKNMQKIGEILALVSFEALNLLVPC